MKALGRQGSIPGACGSTRLEGFALLLAVGALTLLFAMGCGDDVAAGGGGAGAGGEGGAAEPLIPEAGFIEVPAAEGLGPKYASRMFYSFWPADSAPQDAPLVVYFNGGPGFATTSILLAFGTAPATLDPLGDSATPIENPVAHTRFANLLFIDARAAGFSYAVDAEGTPCDVGDSDEFEDFQTYDAADFVYVLLEFLDQHPSIAANPVVLAGESWAGARATFMTFMMQNYASPLQAGDYPNVERDAPWLRDRMQLHLDRVHPEAGGRSFTPDEVASQFGAVILIQPVLFGQRQNDFEDLVQPSDPDFAIPRGQSYDVYDVRMPDGTSDERSARAGRAMRDPKNFPAFFGIEAAEIVGLRASQRGNASRSFNSSSSGTAAEAAVAEESLRAVLGDVSDDDAYWLLQSVQCDDQGRPATRTAVNVFLDLLPRTRMFLTNARYDALIYTEAMPGFLETELGLDVSLLSTEPSGASRPGVLRVEGTDIRFPTYEAGHMVSVGAPVEFAEDVEAWLSDTGLLLPQ